MRRIYFTLCLLCLVNPLLPDQQEEGHVINFNTVSVLELVKFVSRIAKVNFIFKEDLLKFNVSFISHKPTPAEKVLNAFIRILEEHNLEVFQETEDYYIIRAAKEDSSEKNSVSGNTVVSKEGQFFVYKLQYHQGSEIQTALKQVANDHVSNHGSSFEFIQTIQSMQWIPSTNSLFFSGSEEAIQKISQLIKTLDTPLRQVFIEILVIETDIKNSLDFGLQWSASGSIKTHAGIGAGAFPHAHTQPPLAHSVQNTDAHNPPTGAKQFPIGNGFDLGIIGDIIFHKGRSFLTLGALVSALQIDGDTSIVLNQKIITQDNKKSTIFVGDNVPFPGAVVQTVGNGQQTTANIEYRDVGVSLNITPMLGENDIITLDISEEITEAIANTFGSSANMQGIQTTKTNMITSAHVPNENFLVLSGMTRNHKSRTKSGVPCLGGIPWIGRLFSKESKQNSKRNILIFVKPHIINSAEDYRKVTQETPNHPSELENLSLGL